MIVNIPLVSSTKLPLKSLSKMNSSIGNSSKTVVEEEEEEEEDYMSDAFLAACEKQDVRPGLKMVLMTP